MPKNSSIFKAITQHETMNYLH